MVYRTPLVRLYYIVVVVGHVISIGTDNINLYSLKFKLSFQTHTTLLLTLKLASC